MKKRMFVLAAAAAMAFVSAAANAASVVVTTGASWTSTYSNVNPFDVTDAGLRLNEAPHSVSAINTDLPVPGGFSGANGALVYTESTPHTSWIGALAGSNWIGYKDLTNGAANTPNGAGNDPRANLVGYYLFETSILFTTSPGTVTLSGTFASDNRVVGIFVNGVALTFTQTGIPEVTYNAISGTLPSGTGPDGNPVKIQFIVENNRPQGNGNGNPVGLMFSGLLETTAGEVIPLPSAVWGGLALMGMVAGQRMRRNA